MLICRHTLNETVARVLFSQNDILGIRIGNNCMSKLQRRRQFKRHRFLLMDIETIRVKRKIF